MEGQMLDSTLVAVEELSKELSSLKKQNKELKKSTVRLSETAKDRSDSGFLDGAAWMGRKVVDLADRMGERVILSRSAMV
jgi:hypothetical protein